ncbi:hypothetical protein CHUAL_013202 [Chamberlinius hualienensis]
MPRFTTIEWVLLILLITTAVLCDQQELHEVQTYRRVKRLWRAWAGASKPKYLTNQKFIGNADYEDFKFFEEPM